MATKIPGTLTKISDTQFKFKSDDSLEPGKTYKMIVNYNFRSEDGIFLTDVFESTFTTSELDNDNLEILTNTVTIDLLDEVIPFNIDTNIIVEDSDVEIDVFNIDTIITVIDGS